MALIKCPECGREISDKSKMCIQCGFPLEAISKPESKLIIKSQTNPPDVLARQLTFDIFTTTGKKLCTIEPGRVRSIDIDTDVEIYAKPTYGMEWAKEKRKTESICVLANRVTRVQLAFVRVALGTAIKTVLNEIDVIDSE